MNSKTYGKVGSMKASIKNLVYFLGLFLLSLVLFSCYDPKYPPLGNQISTELTASYNNIADELGIPNVPKGFTMWVLDAGTKPFDKAPWDIAVGFDYPKYNIVCSLRVKKEGNSYKIIEGTYFVFKRDYGSTLEPHLCFNFATGDNEFLKKYKYQRLKITYEKYPKEPSEGKICREITKEEAYEYLRAWYPYGDFYGNLTL